MTTERQAEIRDRLTAAGYPTPVGVRRHVWADTYAADVADLLAEIERLTQECDKFERWFLGAAQERDKAQEFCEALARGTHEFMEFIEAAEEARAGHSARLFGLLDAMKGTD